MASRYDKIWIEVDVEPDRDQKTEKIQEITTAVKDIPCVKNVAKVTYQQDVKGITVKFIEDD